MRMVFGGYIGLGKGQNIMFSDKEKGRFLEFRYQ